MDIVELDQVENIRFLRRFAEYFLTPGELEVFEGRVDKVQFIASRFAVKEATIKAFPTLLKPHQFEIVKDGVRPIVRFLVPEMGRRYRAIASISHSARYAAGCALVLEN